jgi:SPP1 family predicted phage head-tail adaptor
MPAQHLTGELTERVTILQDTKTTDTQGGRSASAATLATVWASVRPLNAREQMQAQAVGSNVAYEVKIRHRGDVTPQMRLSWTPYGGSAKTLQIMGVRQPARDHLLLDCAEVG